jgi:hypothetical protein
MSDFTSPSAIKAGVEALEQGYERFLAITKERLETVYPAAATGFDQFDDMRRRAIDNVLSVGKTAAHGWDDLADMVAAHQEAMMEGLRAMNQSWFGGGALDAVEATLSEMRARMTGEIEAIQKHAAELREQQGQALKAATGGFTAEIEAAKQATQGAASEAATAKSEAVEAKSEATEAKSEAAEAKSEATEAKSEAVSAGEAVAALGAEVEQKIDALRGSLDSEIAAVVETQIDSARKEIERETDEEVDEKLGALKTALDERLTKIESALAADIANMRDQIADLAKAAKKPAAAKRTTTKATKKAGA